MDRPQPIPEREWHQIKAERIEYELAASRQLGPGPARVGLFRRLVLILSQLFRRPLR